jgi:hypothetical protein
MVVVNATVAVNLDIEGADVARGGHRLAAPGSRARVRLRLARVTDNLIFTNDGSQLDPELSADVSNANIQKIS